MPKRSRKDADTQSVLDALESHKSMRDILLKDDPEAQELDRQLADRLRLLKRELVLVSTSGRIYCKPTLAETVDAFLSREPLENLHLASLYVPLSKLKTLDQYFFTQFQSEAKTQMSYGY